MAIRVIVNGAQGKMGHIAVEAISNQPDIILVAKIGKSDDLASSIKENQADVVIDFTVPSAVFSNAQTIINNNARPVIGTTGLSLDQISTLRDQCQKKSLGCIIAPNFSLAAVLMMKYAQDAAQYFPDVEIIEMHHAQKLDAPSGTALKTADMIAEKRKAAKSSSGNSNVNSNQRGFTHQGVTIHSVRLPGLFAHQMVIFGELGETLTIKHDATDRKAMMPGILLATRKVMELKGLAYGLENVLWG